MKFILGEKKEMTQKFSEDGTVIPVTAVKAGPCFVTQVKTKENDNYGAVQVGYGFKKKLNKPLSGHLKELENFKHLKEFRLDEGQELGKGYKFDISIFEPGEKVKVTGFSKGKGFQGVVKRHGFSGSPASHGHKDQLRMPGSIGSTGPARVFKGVKMAGRMGGRSATIKNLEIVEVDKKNGLLFIKGALPGARNSLILISAPGDFAKNDKPSEKEGKKEAK